METYFGLEHIKIQGLVLTKASGKKALKRVDGSWAESTSVTRSCSIKVIAYHDLIVTLTSPGG
jgi:hypothetical protein